MARASPAADPVQGRTRSAHERYSGMRSAASRSSPRARETGRPFLRMDTNVKNTAARRLYARLGYREAGAVSCCFNGIPGVQLVCLEKTLE